MTELFAALVTIAALTAWAYRAIWGKDTTYFYLGLPEEEDIIYRDEMRVIIKREDEKCSELKKGIF